MAAGFAIAGVDVSPLGLQLAKAVGRLVGLTSDLQQQRQLSGGRGSDFWLKVQAKPVEQQFRFERSPQYRVAVEGGAVPLPDGLLLAKEIEQRLGPSAARKVAELEIGQSVVIGEGGGQYTVRLLERVDGVLVPFDEARDAIEAAYLRDRSEIAVREFLDVARQRTDIRVEAAP